MPTALTKMYETMTLTEKQELYNFAEFLGLLPISCTIFAISLTLFRLRVKYSGS